MRKRAERNSGEVFTVIPVAKAVSQLLWSDKDHEEWFSLGENHEKDPGFELHQLRNRCNGRLRNGLSLPALGTLLAEARCIALYS
jgi:hypothetical protein